MKDNLYSWFSGFTLSGTAMVTGWIQVGTMVEVLIYGFLGGIAGMLGKLFINYLISKFGKRMPPGKM